MLQITDLDIRRAADGAAHEIDRREWPSNADVRCDRQALSSIIYDEVAKLLREHDPLQQLYRNGP